MKIAIFISFFTGIAVPIIVALLSGWFTTKGVIIEGKNNLLVQESKSKTDLLLHISQSIHLFCPNTSYQPIFLRKIFLYSFLNSEKELQEYIIEILKNSSDCDLPSKSQREAPLTSPPVIVPPKSTKRRQQIRPFVSCFPYDIIPNPSNIYYCRNIFLIVKSHESITSLEVKWNEDEKSQLYKNLNKKNGLFSIAHTYALDGKIKKIVKVRAHYKGGSYSDWSSETINLQL